MMRLLLILALALAQPRPPELHATWEGKQVRVAWSSSAAWVCVYRYPRVGTNVLLNCYREGIGDLVLPWRDAAYKVAPGDRFCADFDYTTRVCSAPLPWRAWLPLAGNGVEPLRVFAPLLVK